MKKSRVVFRADGSNEIGLGHVIRSLALAEMLKDDFECLFVTQEPGNALRQQIEAVCGQAIILPLCSAGLSGSTFDFDYYLKGDEIVVLDGYKFTTNYQQLIKDKGCSLVCIDDIHSYHFVADGVLNHAGGISSTAYSAEPYTDFLLGPKYCLLRSEFLSVGSKKESDLNLKRLFISFGGADPNNALYDLLEKLGDVIIKFEEVHIVIGAAYKHLKTLNLYIKDNPRIILHQNLPADGMKRTMQQCGVAICPPSSVSYEYCSVQGLLFLCVIADNQMDMFDYLTKNKLANPFDDFNEIINSPQRLISEANVVMNNQQKIFDGKSADRLRSYFNGLC